MKEKKDREEFGYDHIVWSEPQTQEELEVVLNAIKISEKEKKNIQEQEQNNSVEINFLKQFEGIDISQLGEEDGG
jgi:hypothetical protein